MKYFSDTVCWKVFFYIFILFSDIQSSVHSQVFNKKKLLFTYFFKWQKIRNDGMIITTKNNDLTEDLELFLDLLIHSWNLLWIGQTASIFYIPCSQISREELNGGICAVQYCCSLGRVASNRSHLVLGNRNFQVLH